jgi:O-antigen/teichoic acid export membrane protein
MITSALKRLGRHSAIYALGPAIQKAIGFLLLPLVTAYIGGRAQYGVTEMAAVTLAVASQVCGINLLHGMTRYHAEYEDPRDRARLVSTAMLLLLASTGLAFALALVFRERGAELLFGSREYAPALVATAGILVLQTAGQVGLRWLQILERSVVYGVLTTAKMLAEVGLKLWFLIALGLNYMGVLYSVLGGELLIALGVGTVIVRRLGLGFSWPIARRLLRYSWPLFFSGLCMFALHQADRFFLLRLRGEEEVGLYALGYKLGAIGNTVVLEAFGLIWFPFVFGLRDPVQVAELCRRVLAWFTLALAGVSLVLAVFRHELVATMAAPEFLAAERILPLVAGGYLAWGIFQIVHTAFYLRERTGLVTLLVAGAAVLNLGLNAALIPSLGYVGAAWATFGTFTALAIGAWILAERVMPVGYEIARVAAPVGLALLLFAASEWASGLQGGLALLPKTMCVLAFPVLLAFGGYLRPDERERIGTAIRGRWRLASRR